jgi:hypothetical protein
VVGFPCLEDQTLYNSIAIVDSRGELVTVYHKSFLYETDEVWASEGPAGFQNISARKGSFRHLHGFLCIRAFICFMINPLILFQYHMHSNLSYLPRLYHSTIHTRLNGHAYILVLGRFGYLHGLESV